MNILDVKEGVIIQQVNCKGVMGAGLAKDIRNKWPIVYKKYKEREWSPGDVAFVSIDTNLYVCNLAGQYHYGREKGVCYTIYEAVELGLTKVNHFCIAQKLQAYIPYKMGCNLGGGDWRMVEKIINKVIPNAIICVKGDL